MLFSTTRGTAHSPKLFENRRDEGPTGTCEDSCLRGSDKPEHTRRKHLDGRRETVYL